MTTTWYSPLLIPSPTLRPSPLPSGSPQNLLCVSECVSVLLVLAGASEREVLKAREGLRRFTQSVWVQTGWLRAGARSVGGRASWGAGRGALRRRPWGRAGRTVPGCVSAGLAVPRKRPGPQAWGWGAEPAFRPYSSVL